MRLRLLLLSLIVAALGAGESPPAVGGAAPPGRWEADIQAFEAADRANPPRPGAIVFYGSSTFTLWTTLAEDLPGLPVVNRGFGGSGTEDAMRHLDRVVVPHRPRAVVLYAGGNDLGRKTPEQIRDTMAALVDRLHAALPETRIVLLSLKPTRKRLDQAGQVQAVNRLYAALAAAHPAVEWVDLWVPLLDAAGQPDGQWLAEDGHHPSPAGYGRIAALVRPQLLF